MHRFTLSQYILASIKLALIALVALVAFPSFSTSGSNGSSEDNSKQLARALRERIGDFSVEVRDINGNLKEQASSFPKQIQDSQFSSTIFNLGTTIYDAQIEHTAARKDLLDGVRQDIQTFGIDETDPNQLRGNGGCTDKQVEEWLWAEPSEFGKDLQNFGQKVRFLVEHFEEGEDRLLKLKPGMSVQVFPDVRDEIIFTGGVYEYMEMYESYSMRTRIGGIVGGSYGNPSTGNTIACAGVFGWAPPGSTVDVMAVGLNGPFMGSDTADENGNWRVQLEGLSGGYYQFWADDGETEDVREQAFRVFELEFKF